MLVISIDALGIISNKRMTAQEILDSKGLIPMPFTNATLIIRTMSQSIIVNQGKVQYNNHGWAPDANMQSIYEWINNALTRS